MDKGRAGPVLFASCEDGGYHGQTRGRMKRREFVVIHFCVWLCQGVVYVMIAAHSSSVSEIQYSKDVHLCTLGALVIFRRSQSTPVPHMA